MEALLLSDPGTGPDGDDLELNDLTGLGGGQPGNAPLIGVRALMLAVLEDAIRCLLGADAKIAMEAELWIRSRERTSPFSFEVVCEALGLDSSAVRVALRRMNAANASRRKFVRRVRSYSRTPGHVCLRVRDRSKERRAKRFDAAPRLPSESAVRLQAKTRSVDTGTSRSKRIPRLTGKSLP